MPKDPQLFIDKELKRHFGFEQFRLGQRDAIADAIAGHDILVIMPTGMGKSLCYQLAAMVADGIALIVSPLIALMQDQVNALAAKGLPATCINSSISRREYGERLTGIRAGKYKIVYVAPERFRNVGFMQALNETTVALIAIDEAHCISQWGHDFRPDYLRIKTIVNQLPGASVMALTATATPAVRDDIIKQLGLDQRHGEPRIHVHGFARDNLTLSVTRTATHKHKIERILSILRQYSTGIIYCATRKNTEKVSETLKTAGIDACLYHAGLTDTQRRDVQQKFMSGVYAVVVATNAFGMGVDRSDLRTVIHWDIPGSLEAYYQEVGRAGRDGFPSHCELLYNYADVHTQEFFLEGSNPQPVDLLSVWNAILHACANGPVTISGEDWARQAGLKNKMMVRTCMAILERADLIHRVMQPGSRTFTTEISNQADAENLKPHFAAMQYKRQLDRAKLQTMLDYASARSCRHAFILEYFGENDRPTSCNGHCDRCDHTLVSVGVERHPPTEDQWIVIQKVLSCIVRMRGRFGVKRVIQVLQGSHSKAVIDRGLHSLSTYGLLKGTSEPLLRKIIEELITANAAMITPGEYPMLAITRHGIAVAKRESRIEIAWPTGATCQPPKQTAGNKAPALIDNALADRLREWRERKAHGKPLYTVLSNRTLNEIAALVPTTEQALLDIHGMGPRKLARLGVEILELIHKTKARDNA